MLYNLYMMSDLSSAFSNLKKLASELLNTISKIVYVDVTYECIKCRSKKSKKNEVLFKSDSIICRASFMYNILNEIHKLEERDIIGKVTIKEVNEVGENLIKRDMYINLYYIFHGDRVQMKDVCSSCSCCIFEQHIDVIDKHTDENSASIDEITKLIASITV